MNYAALRTEFSFGYAIGKVDKVLDSLAPGTTHAGIADRGGTWGHVAWATACKKRNIKPLFGVELACVIDADERERQPTNYVTLIAKNNAGLKELYAITTIATEKFFYFPRIDYNILATASKDIAVLVGHCPDWGKLRNGKKNLYANWSPSSPANYADSARRAGIPLIASVDNLYPAAHQRYLHEVLIGDNAESRTSPSHILSEAEWLWHMGVSPAEKTAFLSADKLCKGCDATLPKAEIVHPEVKHTLREMCTIGAKSRKVNLRSAKYKEQLERELKLIGDKKFDDYLFLVADLVNWARERMMVGPARGSSCGSLVCYLLGITDIDPIPFDLLFERFIDINREDYPDIDIDFCKDKRDLLLPYLQQKYGHSHVSRLGSIAEFQARSAIDVCAKVLHIPDWEVKDLKGAIIERSSGDARAAFCIIDTFEQLDIGKRTLAKYPELRVAGDMEGAISFHGTHAAGILVAAQPIQNYCAVDSRSGGAMLDKNDAEKLGLLKIDALGLRTLTIIGDCLEQIGWPYQKLKDWPLDDKKAFALLNEAKFAGVFQFEGYALQSVCRQMTVEEFEDVAVLTALARPGPLSSGGTGQFIKRRTGKEPVTYLHALTKRITQVTYGVIVYQEQVMQIAREVGALSWEDVSELRKAMSKSKGKEFFDGYWQKFWAGAKKVMTEEQAQEIWDNINTMGSWAFNRSHAVAYGMISYWCLVLKAHFPLQFAAATLRSAKDDEQAIRILRELTVEGFTYKAFCPKTSTENWSVQEGQLVGGLTGIKGIGEKKAQAIMLKRKKGLALTPREKELLQNGKTPWDTIFERETLWGHIIANPLAYNISSRICTTSEITEDSDGKFVFIAKVKEKNLRDHNEDKLIEKRKGTPKAGRWEGQTLFLNLVVEDDTGTIICNINRQNYLLIGKPIIETVQAGDWIIFKGNNRRGFRRINLERWIKLTGNPEYAPKDS